MEAGDAAPRELRGDHLRGEDAEKNAKQDPGHGELRD